MLIDNPPELDVNNGSMGLNMVRNMLEVHDRGIALCQGCHLQNLQAYTHKFLGYLTMKYDQDLRPQQYWKLSRLTSRSGLQLQS